ncbi:hypothetical protein CCP3SC15_800008 [Gammaproteobacteria bacterium]
MGSKKSGQNQANLIRYADDKVITGSSKELLENEVKPLVEEFLKDIRDMVKGNKQAKQENLIRLLNPEIRGWANYHMVRCR